MSLAFTRLVAKRGKGLTAKANAVLRVLADRADAKGRSFPTQERLAEDTGLSPKSVWLALKELEETGWITRERRQRRDGSRTSDLITIRDEEAIARHVEAMLRLPLMVALTGGQAVNKAVDEQQSNSSGRRVGQLVRVTTQEPITYSDHLTDHCRAGAPPAPGEGAALPLPIPARKRA